MRARSRVDGGANQLRGRRGVNGVRLVQPSRVRVGTGLGFRRRARADRSRRVSELEILKLQHELTVADILVVLVLRQDVGFPTGRAAVGAYGWLIRRATHDRPVLRISPKRTHRLDQQAGVEARLLVS